MNSISVAKFCISGQISNEDLESIEKTLTTFGCEIIKSVYLHKDCTHLLVTRLAKTEKILSALARGIPILDLRLYMQACREKGCAILSDEDLSTFDVGSEKFFKKQFKIPELTVRRQNEKLFSSWRVALYFNDQKKSNTYERVLSDGGAKTILRLSSPFDTDQLSNHRVTHLLSEPCIMEQDEFFMDFVQRKNPDGPLVLSYFIVVETLCRQRHLQSSYFTLSSGDILKLHQTCISAANSQDSTSSQQLEASLPLLNISIDACYEDRKRQFSSQTIGFTPKRPRLEMKKSEIEWYFPVIPNSTKKLGTLSEIVPPVVQRTSSLPPSTSQQELSTGPLRTNRVTQLNEKKCQSSQQPILNDSSDSNSSQSFDSINSNEIGHLAFKFAQDRAALQKCTEMLNVCPGSQICLKMDLKRKSNSKRRIEPEPLQYAFQSFFETFMKIHQADMDERTQTWLTVLSFTESYISQDRYLNLPVLHTIFTNGIRDNPCPEVRKMAAGILSKIILFQHPPSSGHMRSYYLKAFVTNVIDQNDLGLLDLDVAWEFFSDLLNRVMELDHLNQDQFYENGSVLLLDLVVQLIELDLTFATKEFLHKSVKTLSGNSMMLIQLLWPSGTVGSYNNRFRRVVDFYLVSFESSLLSLSLNRRLIQAAAQVISMADIQTNSEETKLAIASYIANRWERKDLRPLCRELYLLDSDWLTTMVTFQLLSRIRKLNEMSLRLFERNILSFSDDKIKQKLEMEVDENETNVVIEKHPSNKTVSKTVSNKRNKYGETPLHVACRTGNVSRVREILESSSYIDVNTKDNYGWTSLHEAATYGRTDCIQLLLDFKQKTIPSYFSTNKTKMGIDYWCAGGQGKDGGITPLHDAVRSCNPEAVDLILQTVLKREGHSKQLEMLSLKTNSGHTVFDLAKTQAVLDILKRHQSNNFVASGDIIEIQFPIERLWTLSYVFFCKYTVLFRLHAVKELMKNVSLKKRPQVFSDVRDKNIVVDDDFRGFVLKRKPLTCAEDIKTFWKMARGSENDLTMKLFQKRFLK